jgi:hypothetical protein
MNNAPAQTSWRGLPAYLEDRDAKLVTRYSDLRKMILTGAQGIRRAELTRLDEVHGLYCGRLMDQILTGTGDIDVSVVSRLMDEHASFLSEFERTASQPMTEMEVAGEKRAAELRIEANRIGAERIIDQVVATGRRMWADGGDILVEPQLTDSRLINLVTFSKDSILEILRSRPSQPQRI